MSDRPILVTGAGGFIGGRIVEVLAASGHGPVRAGVRRWSTAAQVGRLATDIVACDVLDAASVRAAADGVSAIVHCAVGDRRTTVEGTRHVLEAARAANVERVIHLSTIDVYGGATGTVSEQSPLLMTGADYGDSKIEAERLCEDARASGLAVTILRPTIVYGPHSALWTVEFADRLARGNWLLSAESTGGTCNLVYVDDVVQAVLRALKAPVPLNSAYNVNGADRPTWHQYFSALNDAMGLPPLVAASAARSRAAAAAMAPVRRVAKWALRQFPGVIKSVYHRSALAKQLMKSAESAIRASPTTNEFRLYSRTCDYPTDAAQRDLGYVPAFSMADGIALSVAWLGASGYRVSDTSSPR